MRTGKHFKQITACVHTAAVLLSCYRLGKSSTQNTKARRSGADLPVDRLWQRKSVGSCGGGGSQFGVVNVVRLSIKLQSAKHTCGPTTQQSMKLRHKGEGFCWIIIKIILILLIVIALPLLWKLCILTWFPFTIYYYSYIIRDFNYYCLSTYCNY